MSHEVVCFQMLDFDASKSNSAVEIKFVENYFFLENYVKPQSEPFLTMCILSTAPHYSLPSKVSYF